MLLNAAKTRCSFCYLWLLRGRRGCGRHWLLCRRILLCRRGRRAVSFGTGASLATRAAGFGLPPNRGPKASRGFTLAGTAGRAAKRLLGSCRLLFCVASGFLTAPRGDGYSSAGAASPVKVALALTVAEGARGAHILFTSVNTRGGWIRSLVASLLRCFLSSSRVLPVFLRLSSLSATLRTRRFAAKASSSMWAVAALAMTCFSSERSLGGSYFLAAFFEGMFGLVMAIGQ